MAAITPTVQRHALRGGGALVTYYGTGAANSADTLTTTAVGAHKSQRLAYVTCAYSNTPTQAGVTVTLDSGLGAGFDTLFTTGSANARYTVYLPDGDIYLKPGDALAIAAPAGGSGLTASITVVVEEV